MYVKKCERLSESAPFDEGELGEMTDTPPTWFSSRESRHIVQVCTCDVAIYVQIRTKIFALSPARENEMTKQKYKIRMA